MPTSLAHPFDPNDGSEFELDLWVEELPQRAAVVLDCGSTQSIV